MPPDSIPCESLHSLDMDYDLWQGQFEIIAPYNTEITNNNNEPNNKVMSSGALAVNGNAASSHYGKSSAQLDADGLGPMMNFGRPLTQILDSEDVFLSLHPSDFESLNIAAINNANSAGSSPSMAGGGEDPASIITRRQQQWHALFPKSSAVQQLVKGKEFDNNHSSNDTAGGYHNGSNSVGGAGGTNCTNGNVSSINNGSYNIKNNHHNNGSNYNAKNGISGGSGGVSGNHNKLETQASETEAFQQRLSEQVR